MGSSSSSIIYTVSVNAPLATAKSERLTYRVGGNGPGMLLFTNGFYLRRHCVLQPCLQPPQQRSRGNRRRAQATDEDALFATRRQGSRSVRNPPCPARLIFARTAVCRYGSTTHVTLLWIVAGSQQRRLWTPGARLNSRTTSRAKNELTKGTRKEKTLISLEVGSLVMEAVEGPLFLRVLPGFSCFYKKRSGAQHRI